MARLAGKNSAKANVLSGALCNSKQGITFAVCILDASE